MLTDRTDQKVLGYLGRALSLELSAVQLYSTQARLATKWGLQEAADYFRNEAVSEMAHADRLIDRMLAYGYAPSASQLRPVELGKNLDELLTVDIRFERELVDFYKLAATYCVKNGLVDDKVFFNELLAEEQSHYAELKDWQLKLHSSTL
ncbi:MAG: ferritin-like domain-containing protein [Gammaproteobacteria bacterium]